MDIDEEKAKTKWLLITGIVFLMSAYFSWRELKYAVFGNTVDARVVRVSEFTEVRTRGANRQKLAIEYEFSDKDGTVRKETDQVLPDDAPPPAPTVQVQYISGSKGASRLPVNSQRWWLLIFFGSLGFAGYYVWRVVKESKS